MKDLDQFAVWELGDLHAIARISGVGSVRCRSFTHFARAGALGAVLAHMFTRVGRVRHSSCTHVCGSLDL